MTGEPSCLAVLQFCLERGHRRPTRCTLQSTGEPIDALTVFAPDHMVFDLRGGFPLLTTKKVNVRGVIAELLWFLSGSSDVRDLQAMGSRIWDAWADEAGHVGPSYGHNWRRYGATDGDSGIDQIAELVASIRAVHANPRDDRSRRLILTALDPLTVDEAALYPCHLLAQFDVWEGQLSCHLTQRSADLFLGVPFNVASYALLTHLLARATGLRPRKLTVALGNAHLYTNHLEQAREQLTRAPYVPPALSLPNMLFEMPNEHNEWSDPGTLPQFAWPDGRPLTVDSVEKCLRGYNHHPALPGEVAV